MGGLVALFAGAPFPGLPAASAMAAPFSCMLGDWLAGCEAGTRAPVPAVTTRGEGSGSSPGAGDIRAGAATEALVAPDLSPPPVAALGVSRTLAGPPAPALGSAWWWRCRRAASRSRRWRRCSWEGVCAAATWTQQAQRHEQRFCSMQVVRCLCSEAGFGGRTLQPCDCQQQCRMACRATSNRRSPAGWVPAADPGRATPAAWWHQLPS